MVSYYFPDQWVTKGIWTFYFASSCFYVHIRYVLGENLTSSLMNWPHSPPHIPVYGFIQQTKIETTCVKFYFCQLSRALVFHTEMQSQELRYQMILGSEIIALNTKQVLIIISIILLQWFHEHLLELLQVDCLHDKNLVFLVQQLHVVQDHHASGVFPLQLYCHSNLVEKHQRMLDCAIVLSARPTCRGQLLTSSISVIKVSLMAAARA